MLDLILPPVCVATNIVDLKDIRIPMPVSYMPLA
jgi:hypothetical protein